MKMNDEHRQMRDDEKDSEAASLVQIPAAASRVGELGRAGNEGEGLTAASS